MVIWDLEKIRNIAKKINSCCIWWPSPCISPESPVYGRDCCSHLLMGLCIHCGAPQSTFFASSRMSLPKCTLSHVTLITAFPPLLLPKCLQQLDSPLLLKCTFLNETYYVLHTFPALSLLLKPTFPPSGLYTS